MRRIALALIACLALSPLTLAQEEPSAEALLADKLDEIMALLRELIDSQRTELALRALQVKSNSMERSAAREQTLKDRISAASDQRSVTVVELEKIVDQLDRIAPGSVFERIALQNQARLESELENFDKRIEELEIDLREVENSIIDAEEGLFRLETLVDAALEGL